jgi:long-chain acyl-CoA synthetase
LVRLKLKRPQTAKCYRDHLDELYDEGIKEEEANGKVKAKL